MIDSSVNARISVTLDKEVLEKLDRIAKESSRNRSKMIEYLIKSYEEK